jgi:RNA 3'-terminal phosphate cyclase (ATP)
VRAVHALVGGRLEGAELGSRELAFRPGTRTFGGTYSWAIGSAGSATALTAALMPLLCRGVRPVEIELEGGLFQDAAPTAFHLEHVLAYHATRMGARVRVTVVRPGYVPEGSGVLRVTVQPARDGLRALRHPLQTPVVRLWGFALASNLAERHVAERIASAALDVLHAAGHDPQIDEIDDVTATQRGAAFAVFADCEDGARLGADLAGAPHRRAERLGAHAARQLLEDLATGATVDRHYADQLVPFAALAAGATQVRIPAVSAHLDTAMWLAREFLDVDARVENGLLTIEGRANA